MKYIVYYKDIQIGVYNVLSKDNVEYVVDKDGLKKIEEKGLHPIKMLLEDYSGKSFPLFDNRIKNCLRFGKDTPISYHTDGITLKEVE